MCKNITVPADDVWTYFELRSKELKNSMCKIAENEEYGVAIYLTEHNGLPYVFIFADDIQMLDEEFENEKDCGKRMREIYNNYLSARVLDMMSGEDEDPDNPEISEEDEIYERELELECAVTDFLNVALDGYMDTESEKLDNIIEDCKDHFCEYLARKHDLPIRRPMYLEYEDGTEEYDEFPYENMEFEDEDNPIYKN